MTEYIDITELHELKDIDSSSALIIDLRKLKRLIASPVPDVFKQCQCSYLETDGSNHCLKCGTSIAELGVGLNSYELYSIIYKFIEIHSSKFSSVCVLSNEVVPLDFVGGLNKNVWIYLARYPYRRTILHITNQIVYNDSLFTVDENDNLISDKLTYISVFSSTSEVKKIHKAKIMHSTSTNAVDYINLILGSSGCPVKYVLS